MLRNIILAVGLTMSVGSGVVGVDYARQTSGHTAVPLGFSDYLSGLGTRTINLMETPRDSRAASLPQMPKPMTSAHFSGTGTVEDQINEFAKGSPQLKAMLKADRAAAKERWWGRIRQKVTGDVEKPRTNRLSSIRERNFPSKRKGITPADLQGMNALQLYMNRGAITEGLSNTVRNNMSGVTGTSQGW